MSNGDVDVRLLQAELARLKALQQKSESVGSGGSGPHMPEMNDTRIGRLEGAFEGLRMAIDGLRHSQNTTIGLLTVGFAVVLFFMGYLLTRIDNLPSEFERLNQTLSNAITASKQQPPQVILVPTPQPQPPQAPNRPQ